MGNTRNSGNPQTLTFVKKVFRAFFLFGVLVLFWHGSLLINLLRPSLITLPLPRQTIPVEHLPDNTFVYQKLGIQAPIINDPQTSPIVTSDWEKIRTALNQGVSLAYTTSNFNDTPLAFITGHSSDSYPHPFDSVFVALGQATTGDTFAVKVDKTVSVYTVLETKLMNPNDTEAFKQLVSDKDGIQRVVLVTCWPPLTTKDRLVIVGEKISGETAQKELHV